MGWFSSKKEEDMIPSLPSLQQMNPASMQPQQSFIPANISSHSNSSPQSLGVQPTVSREISVSNGQMNRNEPFFVRIDKFNEARKSLVEIERKLRDMENILVKIGETKQKEDEEIDSWKTDMKTIRNYLEDINESVFSRL